MSDVVNTKFGLFDLLKVLDAFHGGELHDEFARIARDDLGLELPVMAPPPDGEDEAAGEQVSEQDRIHGFLATQAEPVSLGQIIAELGLKKWTATSALTRLQRKGRIEHVGHDAWRVRGAE